jgi:hypothetical protein
MSGLFGLKALNIFASFFKYPCKILTDRIADLLFYFNEIVEISIARKLSIML